MDNFAAMSCSQEMTNEMLENMVGQLRLMGLPVHEVGAASLVHRLLGWTVDGDEGRVSPTPERTWKIIMATRALLRAEPVAGEQLRRL